MIVVEENGKLIINEHIKDCQNCREAFELLVSNLRAHGFKLRVGVDSIS